MYYLQKPSPQVIAKLILVILEENFLITTPNEQCIVRNSRDHSQMRTQLKICGGKRYGLQVPGYYLPSTFL